MKHPIVLAATAVAVSAFSQAPAKISIADLEFLVGRWGAGVGVVAETGGTSKGSSVITIEANGMALLRRDHTDLFDKAGKPTGGFESLMLIYPEGDTWRAEYTDGQHVIHYREAQVVAGKSVTFLSAREAGAPIFRLRYDLATPAELNVDFGIAPPGAATFNPIASGSLRRQP
jgi:hypothetical protein